MDKLVSNLRGLMCVCAVVFEHLPIPRWQAAVHAKPTLRHGQLFFLQPFLQLHVIGLQWKKHFVMQCDIACMCE